MEEPTSKKTKEPPSRANHKGNIKFLNPLSREANQIKKGEVPTLVGKTSSDISVSREHLGECKIMLGFSK